MIKLAEGLYVGDIHDYEAAPASMAVVSATQATHYERMGWSRTNRPLKLDPNYIVLRERHHLSLNWVDGDAYLYNWSGPETFQLVLDFIQEELLEKSVLVHCDQGLSRSPTLCLLYLAKRATVIPGESFQAARAEFQKLYRPYAPGGIATYVENIWDMVW